jgi:predicted secreted protein
MGMGKSTENCIQSVVITDKETDESWDIFIIGMKNQFLAVGCGLWAGHDCGKKGLGRL